MEIKKFKYVDKHYKNGSNITICVGGGFSFQIKNNTEVKTENVPKFCYFGHFKQKYASCDAYNGTLCPSFRHSLNAKMQHPMSLPD